MQVQGSDAGSWSGFGCRFLVRLGLSLSFRLSIATHLPCSRLRLRLRRRLRLNGGFVFGSWFESALPCSACSRQASLPARAAHLSSSRGRAREPRKARGRVWDVGTAPSE